MKKVKIVCAYCNAIVDVWDYRKKTAKYCSASCRYKGISATKRAKWKEIFESDQKKCSLCKETKSFSDFYKSKQKWDGYDSWCKKCKLLANRKYVKHPEVAARKRAFRIKYNLNTKEKRKFVRMRHLYGLSFEEYNSLVAGQAGKCGICGESFVFDRFCHIDHCHETNIVRGLLCHKCNAGLGFFRESKEILLKAISYIEKCHQRETDDIIIKETGI
jgi:hypothetical protein